MNSRLAFVLLAALLGLAGSSRVGAAKPAWTPAQAEIAARVHDWEVASLAGDVDTILQLTAPGFMGWNLAKPAPIDRAAYRSEQSAFFGQFKVLKCALPITATQVDGETAAAHGRYLESVQDPTGARMQFQGSWTASLRRSGQQWLFLSLSTLADRPTIDEATIKTEVGAALDAFKTAVEKVDLVATLAWAAAVPEFRYVMADGAATDYAGWKQGHTEYFATVTAHRFFPKSQDITVLGPTAALVTWTGAMEIVPKEGAVRRVDPFSATFVFKRMSGAWKLVAQHESGPPPRSVVPAASNAAQINAADAELVAAANARDLERWLACFEEGARLFPPDSQPIAGKKAIRPAAEELMKSPTFAVVHRIDGIDVSPCGTLAWVEYAFELTCSSPDGRAMTETGRDTTLYRKGPDGRWRVVADFWRPSAPPPATPPLKSPPSSTTTTPP